MSDILSQIEKIQGNVRDIKATWGNTIMTLDNIKTSLKADRQKAIDEAYQKGFEAGQHEATTLEYQQGLDEAWECAKRIVLIKTDEDCPYFTVTELKKIFGYCNYQSVFDTYSASEAIEKVKAYEEQQKADAEINVGDEVVAFSGKAIVFRRFTDDKGEDVCSYWYPDENRINRNRTSALEKTGRHFPQVAELFKAMKGDAE